MPTYVCSVPAGSFNNDQKKASADAISRNHSQVTGAPPFFVQVEFEEKQPNDRFLGGEMTGGHVWIRGDIRAGRTKEQRKTLMRQIMEDVSRITAVSKGSIWVYLCNLEPTDMIEYGNVLPEPGEEKEWFEALPQTLQDYLKSLGTTKDNFTL
jgi:phenylpyruvate tautomerase PptA (4-oxalocrotonate tautomerase family)